MSVKELVHNKWVKFSFWALLYTLWVIWLGNFWWLLGLIVVFDLFITKKVKWAFWQKTYKEGEKRNALLDWLDAIIFAVIVVTFVNTFFFQAFKIPSSSMESSLLTGDHLFVDKLTYGPRVPQTPLTIPFTHNQIFGKESYSTLIQNDYRRLKGFRKVENGDCVVFCFPDGDTVLTKAPVDDYYTLTRILGKDFVEEKLGPVVVRPADKKDHYVKRCVATPGDTLQVIDGLVWINSEKQEVYPGVQLTYTVKTKGQKINTKFIEELGLNQSELYYSPALPGYPAMPLTESMLEKIKGLSAVESVEPNLEKEVEQDPYSLVFPFEREYGWTRDYFGPLVIPQKGVTVELTTENLPLYRRLISVYEGHDLKVNDEDIFIDGVRAHEYTFAQDYYFMMGDNRHNSLDSRYWGFVPEDHVVGRPAIIWLSTDKYGKFPMNIRWKRFLKIVKN